MTNNTSHDAIPETAKTYEAPELQIVGEASQVILGMPGGGFDGPYGMTEPQFEFEEDGELR